ESTAVALEFCAGLEQRNLISLPHSFLAEVLTLSGSPGLTENAAELGVSGEREQMRGKFTAAMSWDKETCLAVNHDFLRTPHGRARPRRLEVRGDCVWDDPNPLSLVTATDKARNLLAGNSDDTPRMRCNHLYDRFLVASQCELGRPVLDRHVRRAPTPGENLCVKLRPRSVADDDVRDIGRDCSDSSSQSTQVGPTTHLRTAGGDAVSLKLIEEPSFGVERDHRRLVSARYQTRNQDRPLAGWPVS